MLAFVYVSSIPAGSRPADLFKLDCLDEQGVVAQSGPKRRTRLVTHFQRVVVSCECVHRIPFDGTRVFLEDIAELIIVDYGKCNKYPRSEAFKGYRAQHTAVVSALVHSPWKTLQCLHHSPNMKPPFQRPPVSTLSFRARRPACSLIRPAIWQQWLYVSVLLTIHVTHGHLTARHNQAAIVG